MARLIMIVQFAFDALNILPKCQQAELLFSMFADGTRGNLEGQGNANKILMDNFLEHMKQLHNKELLLTSAESQKFTKMLLERRRNGTPILPLFIQKETHCKNIDTTYYPRWKCFIKGISTTHVIITLLPASEKDVRLFMSPAHPEENSSTCNSGERNTESAIFSIEMNEKQTEITVGEYSERNATESQIGRRISELEESLVIPIYVYDCPLALLIDTLVDKSKATYNKDIYQDHTYRVGKQDYKDFVELKSDCYSKPSSPEPKSEDSDNILNDQRSLVEHCKLLSLAHCNCYVVAIYKSLVLQQPLTYEDMEAAVEQCEETLIEINITNYLRYVCRHLNKLSEQDPLDLNSSACNTVRPLHNLIKEKFERIISFAFKPVPAHPELYYCSPSWPKNETVGPYIASKFLSSLHDADHRFACFSRGV